MADDNGSDERGGSDAPARGRGVPPPKNSMKVITIVVGVIVVLVALLQISSIQQREMRLLEMESQRQEYQKKMEFRARGLQKRFDTIESNRQADILESQFKPLEQTLGASASRPQAAEPPKPH